MTILSLTSIEMDILRFFRNISSPFLDKLFETITFLGEQYVLIIIIAFFYFAVNKEKTEKVIYSIFVSMLFNSIIKLFVLRERPFSSVHDNPIIPAREQTATGYSFPSGHTQNATTVYIGLNKVLKRRWFTITTYILILLIGLSRIWLGVHFPTDVIVGFIIGLLCSVGCLYLINKFGSTKDKRFKIYLITLLCFIPFVIYFFIKYKIISSNSDLNYYKLYKDIFSSFGLYCGFVLAVFIDMKLVNFTDSQNVKTKIWRFFGSLISIIITYVGLKFLFKLIIPNSVILDMIRYFFISFVGLGIYPLIFKNKLFKNE